MADLVTRCGPAQSSCLLRRSRRPLPDASDNLAAWHISQNQRPRPDETVVFDANVVRNSGIHAEEAILANLNKSRNDYMGRQKTVFVDARMVANMVSAPQYGILTNTDAWMDNVVLEN